MAVPFLLFGGLRPALALQALAFGASPVPLRSFLCVLVLIPEQQRSLYFAGIKGRCLECSDMRGADARVQLKSCIESGSKRSVNLVAPAG